MAATFTLPEELFDSMIHYFGHTNEPKDELLSGKEDKNKIVNDSSTRLNISQRKRVAAVGAIFFTVDKIKDIFEKDLTKFFDAIEEQETVPVIESIREELEEEVEIKKEKKNFNFRSSLRKYRMMLRFYTFFKKVFDNFKKFQEDAQEIIRRNTHGNDVTLREALTDEKKRKKYIEQKKKIFHDIIMAFFEDVIMDTLIPLIELVIRILVDYFLELFKKIQRSINEIKNKFGDAALEAFFSKRGIKISKYIIGKILSANVGKKAIAKMGLKYTIRGVLHFVPYVNVVMYAWDAYDVLMFAYDAYKAYKRCKKNME